MPTSPSQPLALHPTNNPLVHTLSDPSSSDPDRAVAYILKVPSQALTHPGRTPYSTLPHLGAFPHFVCLPRHVAGPRPLRYWQDRYLAAIATTSTLRAAVAAAPARLAAAAAPPPSAPTCTHPV